MRISDWSSDVCSSDLWQVVLDLAGLGFIDEIVEPARIAGQPGLPAVAVELDRRLAAPARFLAEGRIAAFISLGCGVRAVGEQLLGRRRSLATLARNADLQAIGKLKPASERARQSSDGPIIPDRARGARKNSV